jgi:hypothetical protein
MNIKGGSFTARDLDSVGSPRRVSAYAGNTWDDSPLIVGPGLHRVEWVHFYWTAMENENDPYPLMPPASAVPTPADVATLASLTITPLTLGDTLAGGLAWTSSGTNPFVPSLADRDPNWLNSEQLAALAVERPGPGQDARLSTVIIGPAEVSLRAGGDGPAGDILRILAGGQVKYENGSEGSVGSQIFEIPAGPVTVEVEWVSGLGTETWPPRKAALASVEVRRPLPEGATSALDAPAGITLFTTHPELWDTDTAAPRSGLAARSRPLPMNPMAFPELSAWVDGQAVLTYWRRAEVPAGTSLPFPGVLDSYNPGPFSWQPVTVPVPDGRHRLVWYSPNSGEGFFGPSARYFLDGFSLQPGTGINAVSLAEALDTPDRTWICSGNDATPGDFGQLASDGIDAVSLAPVDQITPAWVETTVTGPALVSVHSSGATLGVTLNGSSPAFGTTATPIPESLWQRTAFPVPPGQHVLRFAASDPRNPLMLDVVEITPQPALSPADALDAPALTFTTGGGLWQPLQSPVASDGDALLAGGSGIGWVATDISGPARVQFEWQAGPDSTRLTLELDGVVVAVAPPYQPWQTASVEIPAGSHVCRWVFTSPQTIPGAPAGLNQLIVTPLAGLTLGDALDAPGQIWISSGPLPPWSGQTELSRDGVDAAHVPTSEDESTDGGSDLQTSVTGRRWQACFPKTSASPSPTATPGPCSPSPAAASGRKATPSLPVRSQGSK